MKRYLLFAGYSYYPSGGWEDYVGSYDTMEEVGGAIKEINDPDRRYNRYDWWHYVDTEKMMVVGGGHK